ncbi:Hsp20/alpha crystallin family protein [Paucibacter sp. R3-3]|uniref:Hsp20/alpha crystallin family protein n=1 Tax=Roseateles agri TaxID=3098619 RepID=A0ABU5DMI5_9BURK|nr:Hsp20/alpha crystallin family protein [Paucibacter sp. R3-3]MDY0747517.1 Hsp20/alpha crystallin family protein [Paucibacter sp. R3-3]
MFVFPVARTRYNPELSRRIERLFDVNDKAVTLRSPALDVSETDAAYTLQLDLPGIAKEAVKVRIEGRKVSIDAEQAAAAATPEGTRVVYSERSVTRFSRTLTLPVEVSKADSVAKIENGVLTLTLVKRQPDNAGELTVN